ncbi:MAG: polymer-forming cytoskeletal protein [Sphingobacteriales bacterium]|jgi:cytoskeletal protein CcmA (bactofilin family)|nr:polymer-forming cytoskeletal protein [Sphingobacteriales bacterium]
MFSLSPLKAQRAAHSHSILNRSIHIKGNLCAEGDLRIDGTLTGNLVCQGRLVIGEHAVIQGDIVAENIDMAGKVTGHIRVRDTLYLRETAELTGDVTVAKFVVEPQAKFVGNCCMLAQGEFSFELTDTTHTVISDIPQNHTNSAKSSAHPPRKPR